MLRLQAENPIQRRPVSSGSIGDIDEMEIINDR